MQFGKVKSHLMPKKNGFGYDPIFYLDEYGCTSAELDQDIKNEISHRAIALKKFEIFIKTHVKSA